MSQGTVLVTAATGHTGGATVEQLLARGRVAQPLLATLTRLLVAGTLGAVAVGVLGWGINALFALMACGLVLHGLVMVTVMRRELGLVGAGIASCASWSSAPAYRYLPRLLGGPPTPMIRRGVMPSDARVARILASVRTANEGQSQNPQ